MSHPGRPLRGCFTAWQQPRKGRPQTGTPRPRDRVSLTAVAAERGEALGPRRAARLNFEQEPVTQTTCPLPFSGVPLLLQLEGVGLEGGGRRG